MTTYHDIQADALDRLDRVTPDAGMILTTEALVQDIRLAAQPGCHPKQFVPAHRSAVSLARKAYRQAVALVTRDDFRRLMATAPRVHRGSQGTEPSYVGGRAWTGD